MVEEAYKKEIEFFVNGICQGDMHTIIPGLLPFLWQYFRHMDYDGETLNSCVENSGDKLDLSWY